MEVAEKPWIEGLGDFSHIMNYRSRIICDWETGVNMATIGGSSFRLVCVTKGNRIIFKDTTYTDDYWINLDIK
jgi:hypothetical protein